MIIDKASDYKGKGIVYCKEDGILYLPQKNVSEEEMLQIIEFTQFSFYIDYDDWANIRNNLYTYKDGKAFLIKAIDESGYESFNYFEPFKYVEKKGLVLYDFYHTYELHTINVADDEIDFSSILKMII